MNNSENIENKFWIVVNVNFPTKVTYKHSSFKDAEKEAQRLAHNNREAKFVVMASVVGYTVNDLVKIEYKNKEDNPNDSDYIPF